ncbi:MAG: DUF2752 domain-containing protein [Deltaproteobacteria bacterium]|nr:DUF2752 domain-containing protein [Deltaproteobacteria bacterium]
MRIAPSAAPARISSSAGWLAGLGALVALPVVLAAALPVAPRCVTHALFELPCPGCGLGRGLASLFALDLPGAWRAYPALLPLALLYAASLVTCALRLRGHRSPRGFVRFASGAAWGVVLLSLGHWVVELVLHTSRGGAR